MERSVRLSFRILLIMMCDVDDGGMLELVKVIKK